MKLLLTGANGLLGHDLCRVFNDRHLESLCVDVNDFDVLDAAATYASILNYNPNIVLHCAAYTDVEKAEDDIENCMRVNAEGTANVVEACAKIGASLALISTDYVFSDSTGAKPHNINEPATPLNVYGKSKAVAEAIVRERLNQYYIVRTSWMFGRSGSNFVTTMLNLAKQHARIQVVSDQIGSPTYSLDLAGWLCDLVMTKKYGVYHATNEGFCSFADLAEKTFAFAGLNTTVERISSDKFISKVMRPHNSRLCKDNIDAAGLKRLPKWEDALYRFLVEIREKN